MFKKSAFLLMLLLTVFFVAAQPTFAAENIFQTIGNSISNGVQRFYLHWIPGDKPGKIVVYQALLATQQLKSVQIASDLTANLLHTKQSQATLHLNIKGPTQLQTKTGANSTNQEFSVVGEFSLQGTTLRTAADVKVTPQTFYFKLNEVPSLPNADLSQITGKWYKSENASATQSAELSPEKKQQLNDALMKLLTSAQAGTAHQETKANAAVYTVEVTLPRAAMENYLSTVVEVQSQTKPDQKPGITQALQEKLQKNLDQIGDVKATLWVDKSTFNILHAESNIDYLLQSSPSSANGTAAKSAQTGALAALSQVDEVKLQLVFDFSEFNAPIAFVEPTEAEDSANILSGTLGKVLNAGGVSSVGTSELPTLTPFQRQQLQQLNSVTSEQKQRFLDQISKTKLSTQSGSQSNQ